MFEKFTNKIRSSRYLSGFVSGVLFGAIFLFVPNSEISVTGRIIGAVLSGVFFGVTMGIWFKYFTKKLTRGLDINRMSQLRKQFGKYYRTGTIPNSTADKEAYSNFLQAYIQFYQKFIKFYYGLVGFFALSLLLRLFTDGFKDITGLILNCGLLIIFTMSLFYQSYTIRKMLTIKDAAIKL